MSIFLRNVHSGSALCVRQQRKQRQNPGIDLRAGLLREGDKTDLQEFEEDPGMN